MIRINFGNIIRFTAVIASIAAVFLIGRHSNKSKLDSYESIIRAEQSKAAIWKDNTNLWHNKAETAELKNAEALEYLSKVDERFDNISREFEGVKKDLSNIRYLGITGTQSSYTIQTGSKDTLIVIGHDSTKARYFTYQDSTGWYSCNGIMLNNGFIPLLNFQSRDSLVTVLTRKRRLFRKASYFQEIKSYNPHTKITYNCSVSVNKRRKVFGIF